MPEQTERLNSTRRVQLIYPPQFIDSLNELTVLLDSSSWTETFRRAVLFTLDRVKRHDEKVLP